MVTRKNLREKFVEAEIGFSGANFIIADIGGKIARGKQVQFRQPVADGQGWFILPYRCKILGHFVTGRLGFTRNHGESGTFANPGNIFTGMDTDEKILCKMHGTGSNGKRHHGDRIPV